VCYIEWGRGVVHVGFWWGNLKGREHFYDPGVVGRIVLRWIFWKWDVGGMDWIKRFRIGTGSEHF